MSDENDNTEFIIFDRNQSPFSSLEAASAMRDVLRRESGHHYRVERYVNSKGATEANSGFVVVRATNTVYHPALRTHVLEAPLILLGLVLAVFPVDVWQSILSALGQSDWPSWADGRSVFLVTRFIGGALCLFLVAWILYGYYATSLMVDNQGIAMQQGIITRDVLHIRLAEIKTIGLKQSLLDRLWNVGVLEFTSSGSDGVDIRFSNVPNPARVRNDIQRMIARHVAQ